MVWDEKNIERLKTLWAEGLSASQIATVLGGTTRNAVIGKVTRLGLTPRRLCGGGYHTHQTRMRRTRNKKPKAPVKPREKAKPIVPDWKREILEAPVYLEPCVDEKIPLSQRKTILTLEAGDCRWPIGDPQNAEFHFCGGKKIVGLPYCQRHAARAYQDIVAFKAARDAAGAQSGAAGMGGVRDGEIAAQRSNLEEAEA